MLERMKHEDGGRLWPRDVHAGGMASNFYGADPEDQYVFCPREGAAGGRRVRAHGRVHTAASRPRLQKLGPGYRLGESVTAMELEFKVGSGLGLPGSGA